MKRVLIDRSGNVATRERVYRIPDGFEIDEVDHYEVRRSRVLFEDVVLVTMHRYRGVVFVSIIGILAVLCAWMSWAIWTTEATAGWLVAAFTVLPLLIIAALRLILGVDELNVYGRRTRARMRFVFRKRRARELMDEIVATVRARQSA